MPNWCENSFSVSHKDAEMMKKFVDGVNNGNLFETLVPLPTKDGEWDYGTAIETWGTKWDVSDGNIDVGDDGLSASGFFNTAWGPGVEAYRKLTELGFELDVVYFEPGMCFIGRYTSEDDHESMEYDFENENWRDDIYDDEILERLESEYESWKEWQEECEEDFKAYDEELEANGVTDDDMNDAIEEYSFREEEEDGSE